MSEGVGYIFQYPNFWSFSEDYAALPYQRTCRLVFWLHFCSFPIIICRMTGLGLLKSCAGVSEMGRNSFYRQIYMKTNVQVTFSTPRIWGMGNVLELQVVTSLSGELGLKLSAGKFPCPSVFSLQWNVSVPNMNSAFLPLVSVAKETLEIEASIRSMSTMEIYSTNHTIVMSLKREH